MEKTNITVSVIQAVLAETHMRKNRSNRSTISIMAMKPITSAGLKALQGKINFIHNIYSSINTGAEISIGDHLIFFILLPFLF